MGIPGFHCNTVVKKLENIIYTIACREREFIVKGYREDKHANQDAACRHEIKKNHNLTSLGNQAIARQVYRPPVLHEDDNSLRDFFSHHCAGNHAPGISPRNLRIRGGTISHMFAQAIRREKKFGLRVFFSR